MQQGKRISQLDSSTQILYHDVPRKEVQDIFYAPSLIIPPDQMQMWVKGLFRDDQGELAFLEKDFHRVDLTCFTSLTHIPVVVDGQTTLLVIPEYIDAIKFTVDPQK